MPETGDLRPKLQISSIIHPPDYILAGDTEWLEWRIVDELGRGVDPDQDAEGDYLVTVRITAPDGNVIEVKPAKALTPVVGHFLYQWTAPADPWSQYLIELICTYEGKTEVIDRRLVLLYQYTA